MKISIGSKIKVVCQNGIVEAGTLLEHTDDQLVLELIDETVVIILNPKQNVVAIRVPKQEKESRVDGGVFVDVELKPERYERKEDLRAANLAELHKLRAHEERKRAGELLRSHQPSALPEVAFGTPDYSKPISKHPRKKVRRRS